MSPKKNKSQLKEELKGFQEILDLYPGIKVDIENKLERSRKEEVDLTTLLESELSRLDKIESFFEGKIFHPEDQKNLDLLILKQEKQLNEVKQKLIQDLIQPDSILNNSLRNMFDSSFEVNP